MLKQYKVGDLVQHRSDSKCCESKLGVITQTIKSNGGDIFILVRYKEGESIHRLKNYDEASHLTIIN